MHQKYYLSRSGQMNAPKFSNNFNVTSGKPSEFILSFRFQEPGSKSAEGIIPIFRVAMSRNGMHALSGLLNKAIEGTEGKGKNLPKDRM